MPAFRQWALRSVCVLELLNVLLHWILVLTVIYALCALGGFVVFGLKIKTRQIIINSRYEDFSVTNQGRNDNVFFQPVCCRLQNKSILGEFATSEIRFNKVEIFGVLHRPFEEMNKRFSTPTMTVRMTANSYHLGENQVSVNFLQSGNVEALCALNCGPCSQIAVDFCGQRLHFVHIFHRIQIAQRPNIHQSNITILLCPSLFVAQSKMKIV